MAALILLLLLLLQHINGEESVNRGRLYANRLRLRFEERFNQTCLKYPFVSRFVNQIENTGDKYVVFVYHEQGLRNGGLGDRIGGLITALALSLRTNRTFLIESHNDFGDLFRPYHPVDVYKPASEQVYTWSNWTRWSHYNISYSNNDNTELDLWDCINCVTWKNKACGQDDGATGVGQPIIKLRANRAFLCKWAKHPDLQAWKELMPLGFGPKTNLLEAAGCMMRLVMWPTEKLWAFAAKEVGNLAIFKQDTPAEGSSTRNGNIEYGIQIGMHFRCGDLSYKKPGSFDRACEHDVTGGKDPHVESDYMRYSTPDQLGRCAAEIIFNYTNGLHSSTEELQHASIYERNGTIPYEFPKEDETPPPPPKTLRGRRRRLLHAMAENETYPTTDDWSSTDLGKGKAASLVRVNGTLSFLPSAHAALRKRLPVVYIASDNPASANQMNATCGWPLTYISPKGCHVEMDKSADCNLATTAYWLLLAVSDIIVHQSDQVGSPISAFSRFAAVYGLKGDSLRDAKNCSRVVPFAEMGHKWMGNWFCD